MTASRLGRQPQATALLSAKSRDSIAETFRHHSPERQDPSGTGLGRRPPSPQKSGGGSLGCNVHRHGNPVCHQLATTNIHRKHGGLPGFCAASCGCLKRGANDAMGADGEPTYRCVFRRLGWPNRADILRQSACENHNNDVYICAPCLEKHRVARLRSKSKRLRR